MMLRLLPALLACLVLTGLAAVQIVLPTDELPAAEDGLAPRRPALVDVPAPQDYPEIVARPLFSPGRRPAAGDAAASEDESLVVIGIGTTTESSTALLRTGEGQVRRIRVGDDVNGWTVAAIEPAAITLTRDGESRRLGLGGATAATSNAAPPEAAPADPASDEAPPDAPADDWTEETPPPRPGKTPPPDKSWLPPAMQNMPGIERFITK